MFRPLVSFQLWLCIALFFTEPPAHALSVDLSADWHFRMAGDEVWLPASVPGSVYTDLFNNHKIPDPFFGDNEKKLQWIDTCDWEYETWFIADDSMIRGNHAELSFQGLDTYAKVYLNDSLILRADNMFRTWKTECGKYLRGGRNHLLIHFESAVKKGKAEAGKLPYVLPGEEKVFTRKAQFQYGWDWGPRFVGCGIWKPVTINTWRGLIIRDIRVTHDTQADSTTVIHAKLKIDADKPSAINIEVKAEGGEQGTFYFKRILAHPGTEMISTDFSIKNAGQWWCNEKGDARIYSLDFRVTNSQRQRAEQKVTYGIRSTELIQDPDASGRRFYFRLNNTPVFMKGANWIPGDHFLSRMTKEKYRTLLLAAKEAHINMLRVWGGGIYEDDAFYDLCDSLGILVWQDFMFACAMYPGDKSFTENVMAEIEEQVTRLRNHPCIVLWCGNNEMDEGWKNWGWQKQYNYSKEDSAKIWNDYLDLFHHRIPNLLKQIDPSRPYWESSPSIGWGHEESLQHGDSHYWGVWWGLEPFEIYNKKVGRFMSEYGFQGMPSMHTVESYTLPGDRTLNSSAIKNHQKHPTGFETIGHYMDEWYRKPKDFESYVYVSQLLQAEGIRIAIEAHRRAKPYCMGTLYWQLNDCWPVTSWSSIDYSGNWKALHYAVKSAFEKYLISVTDTADLFSVYIVSDDTAPVKAKLLLSVEDFSGTQLWHDSTDAYLSDKTSTVVYRNKIADFTAQFNPARIFLKLALRREDKIIASAIYYFRKPLDLLLDKPSVSYALREDETHQFTIDVTSNTLARNVQLEIRESNIHFSENYFDLLPHEPRSVTFHSDLLPDEIRKRLHIMSLADAY